jgi:NADPH:quinone reductase-like Zn-dependent oxidoreductase
VKAARIHEFRSPDVIRIDDVPQPTASEGEILVRVAAAGVGPRDALLREGEIAVSSPLPLILGSDLSGVVEATRPGLAKFNTGDEVYGVTNGQFRGAYAEYAVASETMMARKPTSLSFAEAASAPVVAGTAWQMLFDHAHARAGQAVLIHGAAGNVGAYAVQMARNAGLEVLATASSKDLEYVRELGAHWSRRCSAPSSSGSEVTSTIGKALLHLRFRKLPCPLATRCRPGFLSPQHFQQRDK